MSNFPFLLLAATGAGRSPLLPTLGLELLALLGGSASLIWNFIQWRIKRNDDRKAAEEKAKEEAERVSVEKFNKLALTVANQGNVDQETIRLVEQVRAEATRDLERARGEALVHYKELHSQVMMLEGIPTRVAGLESKFEVLTSKIDTLADNDKELKQEMKNNYTEQRQEHRAFQQELLALIKSTSK